MKPGLIFAAVAVVAIPAVATAQGAPGFRERTVVPTARGEWTGPRLPDGQPDVHGHWSNTIGNHNNFTNPQGGAPSRVSDPADGQVPYQAWARAKVEEFGAHLENPIKPEYVEPLARCAPGGPTKSFMWHGYEIRQFPGYVLFLFDSGTRIVHLARTEHLAPNVKLWNGDSIGRWEGNTLVVDVANNNSKSRFSRTGEFVSENARIQERFIFDPAGERFTYEATYTDPTVLTRPFTVTIPNRRITAATPQDGWNNITFPAKHRGAEPIIEAYERTCVENNGEHGTVAAEN
jgi:hypothetical protein